MKPLNGIFFGTLMNTLFHFNLNSPKELKPASNHH